MRRLHFIVLINLLIVASAFAQTDEGRKKINFDDDWKFSLGHASDPSKDFNFKVSLIFAKTGDAGKTPAGRQFIDSSWRTVQLPHDWVVELPFANSPNSDVESHGYKPVGGLFPETSVGWYRKHFRIAHQDSAQRFEIQFDGIFRDAMVWINGIYLGNNQGGYIGMSYDITDFINYGRDNILVVRADASQYEGWFYEGAGIYRHVWLNRHANLHIENDGVFVHTEIAGAQAMVTVETTLYNGSGSKNNCTIINYITDRSGKKISSSVPQQQLLISSEKKTIKQKLIVSHPELWSLENPYLYRVVSIVRSGNKTIDSVVNRFGIRTVTVTKDGLFLNGKYVKVQGVCCHQDHAGVGSALPDYLQFFRIKSLKEMGVNGYRTSHNPPTPELLDACDSLGILVLDETRLLNSGPEYLGQFHRMVLRDRNHPSVFMWSIGNEEGWIHTSSTGKRIAETFISLQKLLDPTRTCTYAADVGNIYKGVNEVIPVRGFNYHHSAIQDYHNAHPLQPLIGTEMGSTVTTRGIYIKDTNNAYVPDQDITAPPWASKAEDWWRPTAEHSWMMGGFVWTGFDYRGEPTPYKWPNINSHFGIMDVCGFPKNIYYYYQSWWTDKDVLHISPHWNWKGKEGQPVDVWVNTNADDVELFLNGKSLGKKDMPRNSHLQWSVPYEPGTLEAVANKKGRKLSAKVETTGAPYEIVLTPYKTTMIADGRDATVINISVTDRQGREVPDADQLIHFTVEGDAKIIGVGNGDPSSHEPDKCSEGNCQRKLFNGKCQVILQSGKAESRIKFEARSEGLQAGSTDIYIVKNSSGSTTNIQPDRNLRKQVGKMLGADISFLPQLEERGVKFSDNGVQKDAIEILKDHGFNYIRLRIFNDPAADSGYSPKKGFCNLQHTKQMAKRIKDAGLKFLLDFHYSDYWADPGKQFKPAAWRNLDFTQLRKAVYDFTKQVIQELKQQGTLPDMVQVGNEINHGMIWPEGNIVHLDSLAQLIKAGVDAIKEVAPSTIIMLHIALGGQHDESVFFLDNMISRGVQFDVIGESYYPKWHGTLEDLKYNLTELSKKYGKDIIVVEYSQYKKEVNDIAFNLPNGKGKGSCIWEPLNTWESIFDKDGKSNQLIKLYDEIPKKYFTH